MNGPISTKQAEGSAIRRWDNPLPVERDPYREAMARRLYEWLSMRNVSIYTSPNGYKLVKVDPT